MKLIFKETNFLSSLRGGNAEMKNRRLIRENRNLACAEGTEIAGTPSRDG